MNEIKIIKGYGHIARFLCIGRERAKELARHGAPIYVDKYGIPRADAMEIKKWFFKHGGTV